MDGNICSHHIHGDIECSGTEGVKVDALLFVIFASPPPPHPRPRNQTGRVGAQYSPTKFPFPSFCSNSIRVILVHRWILADPVAVVVRVLQ